MEHLALYITLLANIVRSVLSAVDAVVAVDQTLLGRFVSFASFAFSPPSPRTPVMWLSPFASRVQERTLVGRSSCSFCRRDTDPRLLLSCELRRGRSSSSRTVCSTILLQFRVHLSSRCAVPLHAP